MGRIGNERTGANNLVLQVAGGQVLEQGTMVALNADGYAVPAAKAADLVIAGVAQSYANNRQGADGAEVVSVRRGAFVMAGRCNDKGNRLVKDGLYGRCQNPDPDGRGIQPGGGDPGGGGGWCNCPSRHNGNGYNRKCTGYAGSLSKRRTKEC